MHNAALAELSARSPAFADWRYRRFDVPPEDLPAALRRLHELGFRGLNLTVPHKVIAFAHVARIDPSATPIGAVNTLRWTPGGWEGFNTDGYGLATAVRETLGRDLADSPIILLGAGGAARGAAVECLTRGCRSLWIANRTAATLKDLLGLLAPLRPAIPLAGFAPDEPPDDLPGDALVINATSAGLRPSDPPPLALDRLPRPAGVYDMIYNPPITPLLERAHALGIPSANGLSMLVHQGARALALWSGAEVPVAAMQRAAAAALEGK
jgi:shikimate dehydrogenase